MAGGISPTSSRKSVPRWAASKRPFLFWCASVKAPFTWPNSSLSRRFSGRAPQLMETNGASRRGERAWMALATSSLPVPLSPVMSTVELVGATERTMVEDRRHGGGDAHDAVQAVRVSELGLEEEVLLLELLALEGVAHDDLQLVHVEGLDQVVVGPELQGGHRGLRGAEGGHDDDDRLGGGRLDVAQDLDAVAVGQLDVGDDHVHRALGDRRRRPAARLSAATTSKPSLRSMMAEHLAHGLLVVDDQDRSSRPPRRRAGRGRGSTRRGTGHVTAAGAPSPPSPARVLRTRDVAPVLAHDVVDDGQAQAGAQRRWDWKGSKIRRCASAMPRPWSRMREHQVVARRAEARREARRPSGMASRPLRARFQKT